MSQDFLDGRVSIAVGDITQQNVDAIVNAANSSLLGGGGVDGAIHAAGGPEILKACRELRRTQYPQGLPSGEAVITTAGRLRARYVIHTVGPIWGSDRDAESLLASCYRRSMELAAVHEVSRIAFPAISTGAFGFPKDRAAMIASQSIRAALDQLPVIQRVHLVFFARADAELFVSNQRFA